MDSTSSLDIFEGELVIEVMFGVCGLGDVQLLYLKFDVLSSVVINSLSGEAFKHNDMFKTAPIAPIIAKIKDAIAKC